MKKSFTITGIIIFFILFYSIENKWYRRYRRLNILEKYRMYSVIGIVAADGQIKTASTKSGYLAYGPYIPLKKGEYEVKYKLLLNTLKPADSPAKIVGYCDIDIEGHPDYFFHLDLATISFQKKNPKELTLRFTVPEGLPKVQFRVYQHGGNNLTLISLKLYPKKLLLLQELLKSGFLTYNIVLFALLFIISVFIYGVKKKYRIGSFRFKQESLENNEPEETGNSVPLNFLIQLGIISFFSLLIFNAYWLNKLFVPITPSYETIIIVFELLAFGLVGRKLGLKIANIKYELLNSCLFFFVFAFIFYVLLKPSLPSLMPVNFSNDCVTHYSWIAHIYDHNTFKGSVIDAYPFGYHLVTAMLSKYTGIPAVKMMHILLAFSVALSTAIIYALIVRVFNLKKDGKLMALLPVFTLFWVRGYYELVFNQFFHGSMVFSYLFMVSFFWALVEYENYPKWLSYISLNLTAVGLVYSYTSYLPLLVVPFFMTMMLKSKIKFSERVKDILAVLLPAVILAVIHIKSGGTSKIGSAVLNHEGYCIPFRFWDFGDFGKNIIGGRFLILSLIGIPIMVSSFRKNLAVISFTISFLLYYGIFFVLKHYFGKFSYYQAYKILYFSPYIAVVYISTVFYFIRKQIIKIFWPFIGGTIYNVLFVIWLLLIVSRMTVIYDMENYNPQYPERLKEPLYLTIDWAKKNVKEGFGYVYHHSNLGNWMKQGFMLDDFASMPPEEYYFQVFVTPPPTLTGWLEKAKKGDTAIVDDLNSPPLNETQKKRFEILFQKENSAVIKKK